MRIPVSRPVASRLLAVILLCGSCLVSLPLQALTLADAEQLALRHNALLAGTRASVDAAQGDARQAALLHNPELSITRENFGNSRLIGFDGPSTTWQLSQRLELSGQHEARTQVAVHEAGVAAVRLSIHERSLLSELRTLWIEAWTSRQRVQLAAELAQAARITRDGVAAQVKAGKVSPVALSRLEVANASLLRRQQQAETSLVSTRQQLALAIGLLPSELGELADVLPARPALPVLQQVLAGMEDSPALREADARIAVRESQRELERANRFPDVTLSVGQRQYEKAGESAWQLGVSLPIPLFNRNQGAILAAEARLSEARSSAAGSRQALHAEATTLHAQLQALATHLSHLETSVLPASASAFSAVNKGYRFGKFGLMDVLDAQRSHADTRFDYLDTLIDYARQHARLQTLIGLSEENTL